MNARIDGRIGGARRLVGAAVLAAFCTLACAAPAWAQFPDNRDLRLNPEDAVSPEYGRTLDERDRQRLEQARQRGTSFMTTFQGAGRPGESGGALAAPGRAPEDGYAEWGASNRVKRVGIRSGPSLRRTGTFGPGSAAPATGLAAWSARCWRAGPAAFDVRLRYRSASAAAIRHEPLRLPKPSRPGARIERPAALHPRPGLLRAPPMRWTPTIPGPVVLELLQAAPRRRGGARRLERVGRRLVLRLSSLTWRGRTVPVDAWAVDPQCACYGIEGEVDRHFLSRVLLPAAARFAEGFLTAAAMPARTLTMQDGGVFHEREATGEREALHAGAGAAAQTLGDILMADAPKETTVRIPHNTPLVVMVARPFAPADPGAWDRGDAGN